MSEMIEQVAKALYYFEPDGNPTHGGTVLWEAAHPRAQSEFRAIAKAAISAMRGTHEDVTLAKVGAAVIFSDYDEDRFGAQIVQDGFNAMIDAALAEPADD